MTNACFQPLHSLDSATPKEPVAAAQPRPGHRPPVHGERLAQGEVLEGELAVAAAEEREEAEPVQPRGDHETAILSGSEPRDQPLGQRMEFWRRTGGGLRERASTSRQEPAIADEAGDRGLLGRQSELSPRPQP
jgi:hypothetical protein